MVLVDHGASLAGGSSVFKCLTSPLPNWPGLVAIGSQTLNLPGSKGWVQSQCRTAFGVRGHHSATAKQHPHGGAGWLGLPKGSQGEGDSSYSHWELNSWIPLDGPSRNQ